MIKAEDLINEYIDSGSDAVSVIDELVKRTYLRPKVRRFRARGPAVNPITGKRKDPKRRRLMRMVARRNRAQRKMTARKTGRQMKARGFYKKLGKLAARIRR